MKLGKLPATQDARDLRLKDYAVSLPPLPKKNFGYGTLFSNWGMLGNDQYGDCVLASGDHQTMLYNRLAQGKTGYNLSITSKNALADYGAITGFDPNTGSGDNGTNVRDALNYRRHTGLVDSTGKRHKIDAYAYIDPGDWDLMLRCVFTFGAAEIGFEVPESAMEQFYNGQIWADVGDTNIVGGHDVPCVGTLNPLTEGSFVTWARRQRMTKQFYQTYNDETWINLSKESIAASGFNVRHIDWASLNTDLGSL